VFILEERCHESRAGEAGTCCQGCSPRRAWQGAEYLTGEASWEAFASLPSLMFRFVDEPPYADLNESSAIPSIWDLWA